MKHRHPSDYRVWMFEIPYGQQWIMDQQGYQKVGPTHLMIDSLTTACGADVGDTPTTMHPGDAVVAYHVCEKCFDTHLTMNPTPDRTPRAAWKEPKDEQQREHDEFIGDLIVRCGLS